MKKSGFIAACIGILFLSVYTLPTNVVLAGDDAYANYSQLAAANVQGIDYKIDTRNTTSNTAVIAIHGGSIEPGTSELANDIAGTRYDFYSFDGTMKRNNFSLHITSTNFDEPAARSLVQKSTKTLSIHGFSDSAKLTYIGGSDKIMIEKVKASLTAAGFTVADAPSYLGGTDADNICNDNLNKAGVQIELSSALRTSFFSNLTTTGRQTKTTEFSKYSNAIKAGLV